jgi:M6 family metalloprotease-like protein
VIPRPVRLLGLVVLCLAAAAPALRAQNQMHPRWEIPGFDFRRTGGWRTKAHRVALTRQQLLARRNFGALNSRTVGPQLSATSVTGTQQVPALIFGYKNTPASVFTMFPPADYAQLLFGATPLGANPYSVRTFYEEMSRDSFSMQGQVLGWVRLDSNEAFYTGMQGSCTENPFGSTSCNGIFSAAAVNAMQNGMRKALQRVDTGASGINFSQFDNDGPDGVPNSGDDDGYVDMIMFAHATRDGACGAPVGQFNNHIWSHRFFLVNAAQTAAQDYVTNDPSAEGGTIHISDYFMASALGGSATGCDSTRIMPIGTAAHEFGHALGLPDLYDTGGPTEGIGNWGLMGAGNFTSPASPSRMEAWSLNELGWVTVAPLTTTGTYGFGAAPVSDTAFIVDVQGANPRNEYFLLENRQASLADTAMIRFMCTRSGQTVPPCGGGLLLWHVDRQKMDTYLSGGNSVNVGTIHGLRLMQADALRQLDDPGASFPRRRGDAGDPYPGVANNSTFSYRTNPAAVKNVDNSFVGFAVDRITQVTPASTMSFRLRFGALTVVQASDTAAKIQFDGATFNVFRDLLDQDSGYTVSVADTQVSANGRTRWRFNHWSDIGARTHTISGKILGDTLTAFLDSDFKLIATASGGSITSNPAVNLAGEFIPSGQAIQLTATPDPGVTFLGWTGDTSAVNTTIVLPMRRPYTVSACFDVSLAITSTAARPSGVMGAAYADTLRSTGCAVNWTITGGALPPGLSLALNGVVSGFPRDTGDFSFTANVSSASQSQSQTFTLSVSAPTLTTANVVAHFLGPTQPLTADEVRYLDFLGNSNGIFDIGDFLAWVQATGAPLTAALQAIDARRREQRRARP